MQITYERYLDQILGGWIGKSMGGAIGARFEGNKGWIEIPPSEMFPAKMPPNDDLDLQVLWLKVLEEKGAAITSEDMAAAWLEGCWYPFNEYGIFRRNWRLGIHPPMSGKFTNQFWETGEGCPIRAEVWGYVFPGAPDLAAKYAALDGTLDHSEQSVGAEMMLAAMASMAFFVPDVRRLATMFMHYLPAGSPIDRLTRAAFQAYDEGVSLRDARDRLMALAGIPEACDSQINIPFTFLGLLYGGNDLQEVMLSALKCGYDTDCTVASAAALVGQIMGASRIPEALKAPVGDELVMGIEYRRPEMTISALARDTARVGVLLSRACATGVQVDAAPELQPFPATAQPPATWLEAEYTGLPAAAPGETVTVTLRGHGAIPDGTRLAVECPPGWTAALSSPVMGEAQREVTVTLHAAAEGSAWPMRNLFTACLDTTSPVSYTFGVAGAGLWRFLGVYYDALPDESDPVQQRRRFNQHFVSLKHEYLPEPDVDVTALNREWSRKLGQPAIVASYEHEIDLTRLIGLRGPYCAYLARTLISPDERPAGIVIGNNDGYRLYLNGELVAERDEQVWWAPFNNTHRVTLRKGENHLLVKLVKRGDDLRFTLGVKQGNLPAGLRAMMAAMPQPEPGEQPMPPIDEMMAVVTDWMVDLSDAQPSS
jgi:ADP-ribosylglycohydrolase